MQIHTIIFDEHSDIEQLFVDVSKEAVYQQICDYLHNDRSDLIFGGGKPIPIDPIEAIKVFEDTYIDGIWIKYEAFDIVNPLEKKLYTLQEVRIYDIMYQMVHHDVFERHYELMKEDEYAVSALVMDTTLASMYDELIKYSTPGTRFHVPHSLGHVLREIHKEVLEDSGLYEEEDNDKERE